MQLLLYASKNDKNKSRLEEAIQAAAPGVAIEHFTRSDDLRDRLRNIVEPNSIAVLMAVDRKELLKMQMFVDLLTEIYVILVIPDLQKSTIRLAHFLRPRFISFIKDDFMDLNQIVVKMIQAHHGSSATLFTAVHPSASPGRGHEKKMSDENRVKLTSEK